jgi:hypothetical protein
MNTPATGENRLQSVTQAALLAVYHCADKLMAHIGYIGEIDSRHELTLNLLHALNDADNFIKSSQNIPQSVTPADLEEFEQAAFAVFGSNTALFFAKGQIPGQEPLQRVISRCQRMLAIAEHINAVAYQGGL